MLNFGFTVGVCGGTPWQVRSARGVPRQASGVDLVAAGEVDLCGEEGGGWLLGQKVGEGVQGDEVGQAQVGQGLFQSGEDVGARSGGGRDDEGVLIKGHQGQAHAVDVQGGGWLGQAFWFHGSLSLWAITHCATVEHARERLPIAQRTFPLPRSTYYCSIVSRRASMRRTEIGSLTSSVRPKEAAPGCQVSYKRAPKVTFGGPAPWRNHAESG